jgi:protein O-mannosyl-transferase
MTPWSTVSTRGKWRVSLVGSSPTRAGQRPPAWAVCAAALFIAALSAIAFAPSLQGQFLNWDDERNFLKNPDFRGLGGNQIRWMFGATLMGHYIPVTWLTLGLNYVLGGMNPWGYHLGNILLHAASAVVFFFVARRLLAAADGGEISAGARLCAATFASLVFAVHPLRVESVAWITERRDVISGLFFLLTVLLYLRAAEHASAPSWRWWYGGSVLACALAMMSKASAMPLPIVLLLLDVYPLRRLALGWRRLLLEKLPFGLLAGATAVAALLALRQGVTVTSYSEYGVGARVAMTAYSFLFYPWKWIWPVELSPLYELPARVDPLSPRFLLPTLAWLVVTAALIAARRRWPAGLAAWSYSTLMLLPVSGAVHAGNQLAHDRYSYLSGLGFALLAGGALSLAWRAEQRRVLRKGMVIALTATAGLIVVLLAAGSWRQSRIWQSSEALWRWAVVTDPSCAICLHNLGSTLVNSPQSDPHRLREAEGHLRDSIRLRPERAGSYHALALDLAFQRRFDEAEVALRQFMDRDPGSPEGPGRLGMIRVDQKRYGEAIPYLSLALARKPDLSDVRADLVTALDRRAEELERAGQAAQAEQLRKAAADVRAQASASTAGSRPGTP